MASKDRPIAVEVDTEDETPDTPAAWEATQAPDVDPQTLLQQMATMLQAYQRQGLVIQRADGSFMIPGVENPLQAEVDQIGSLCECRQCTSYNQLHWRCVTCFQIYEWASQKPVSGWPLGVTGRGGMVYHAVCSQNCGQAFLARKRMRPGMAIPDTERASNLPPGLDEAQVGFFLSGADA